MDAGIECFRLDNSRNNVFYSNVPEECKTKPCSLGIDEAGRGPVLGPMVYGITYCPELREPELKALGCADSKTLTEEQRENLFKKIDDSQEFVGWAVEILSPNFICNNMHRRSKTSLNEVSHNSAISLIRKALELGVNVSSVFVDTVGVPEKYQAKLSALFPALKITVSKKADALFPVVSAASICAKVARDRALNGWTFQETNLRANEEEVNWGSGYPGDPATKKFLADNIDPVFGFPQLVRFSWSTAQIILEQKAAKVEWDEVEEQEDPSTPSVLSFFAKQSKSGPVVEARHRFWTDRKLESTSEL